MYDLILSILVVICAMLPFSFYNDYHDVSGGYDEYEDTSLLGEKSDKTFDAIVIDGNNFIYALYKIHRKPRLSYSEACKLAIDVTSNVFSNKPVFFVLKDAESSKQQATWLRDTDSKTLRAAYSQFYSALPSNMHVVVAKGDDKYRDDFAAIWITDCLKNAALISRDRYRDVSNMRPDEISFDIYGAKASHYKKIFNRKFPHIHESSVRKSLVGYYFNKLRNTGLYERRHNNAAASDLVFVFNTKKW